MKIEKDVIDSWHKAGDILGFRVISPYEIQGVFRNNCIFLPDFGGPDGIIVGVTCPPDFETSKVFSEFARVNHIEYSFINAERYGDFEYDLFVEALIDWGYFGAEETRPSWL